MRPACTLRHLLFALTFSLSMEAAGSTPLDVPFFRQEKNGCGAASVAMVAHYWGGQEAKAPTVPPPAKQVYQQLYTPERMGISLADMKRYLEGLGYQAFTLRGHWADLEQHLSKGRPVIVGLKNGRARNLHFAVLTGVENDHIWLNDPTRKQPHRVKRPEFEKQWQGADRWLLLAVPRTPE